MSLCCVCLRKVESFDIISRSGCNKRIKTFRHTLFKAGRIQRLNDRTLMLICGFGSKFDGDGFAPKTKRIEGIMNANLNSLVCDRCLKKLIKLNHFNVFEGRY